jgi:hypothetical protein
MPVAKQPARREDSMTGIIEERLAIQAEFVSPAGWRQSQRGNVYREWGGALVTVFFRNGRFRWSIADGDEIRYSPRGYETADDAIVAVGESMGAW